ncbi:MAG: AIR synthase-related protein [Sulfurifustaceae bacterium]
MLVVVPPDQADGVIELLAQTGESAMRVGHVEARPGEPEAVIV